MRKWLLLVAMLIPTGSAFSQLLVEQFTTPGPLTGTGWVAHSGSGSNVLTSTATQLSFPGYIASPSNSADVVGAAAQTREDVNKGFTAVTSGSVYVSFMVNVASASATNDYFVHLGIKDATTASMSTSAFLARLHIKDDGGVLRFGLGKGSNTPVYTTVNYAYNTTYIAVLKYEIKAAGTTDDEDSLFILESGATFGRTEPTPTLGPIAGNVGTSGVDPTVGIEYLALRQGSQVYSAKVAGIRVTTSWGGAFGVANENEMPEGYALTSAFPNPFNPSASFSLTLPATQRVSVAVYNMMGQQVATLHEGILAAGTTQFTFNAAGLPSGVYLYRATGANFQATRKMTLLK